MPSSQNDGYIHQPLSHNDGVSFQLRTGSSKSIKTGGGREGSRAGGGREGSRSGGGRDGSRSGGGRGEERQVEDGRKIRSSPTFFVETT